MIQNIRVQVAKFLAKLQVYTQTRPNRSKAIFGASALIAILLISIIVAVVMKKEDTKTTEPVAVAQTRTAQITITKEGFVPATISVQKGTKITWTNSDDQPHQLQANPHPTGESLPGLQSEILNNQQTYEYTADSPGTYGYHDHVNPTTNGTIEVRE